ncbi:FAD:protein FMN transferase [Kordiimonas aestuarii]|uniref:FAD:protein FMN transferase n=1 Tax=Kordiimonas aestuarii TaxID=1005925 RepID=UPI0021D13D34|nr:FAD:protein FMN transferase [Kordiimonas aestuarii]
MHARQKPLLGTFVDIAAAGERLTALRAIGLAFDAIETVHNALSFQSTTSELTRLNRAGGQWCEMSAVARRIIRLARGMTHASGGLFNATLGGELVRRGLLPDHGFGDVCNAGAAVDIGISGSCVRLSPGTVLSLDGIAKGFAVDSAVAALMRAGVPAGVINAGGDMRAFGHVVVPVARRELDGSVTPLGGLQRGALASSARLPSPDSRYPGHILGAGPFASGVWTVQAAQCWRADALTKVASLAPAQDACALVEKLGGKLVMAPQREGEAAA